MDLLPPPSRRSAPYASGRSLREFLQRIQGLGAPARVDREYLRRLQVARNNEWALLSALKFLGILTSQGVPTPEYRLLQTTDRWRPTLSALVRRAYSDLITTGGLKMDQEALRNYFRLNSSASQAKNAARFFREVAELSGLLRFQTIEGSVDTGHGQPAPDNVLELPAYARRQGLSDEDAPVYEQEQVRNEDVSTSEKRQSTIIEFDPLIRVRLSLLEKMPQARPDWSADDYRSACDRFVSMCDRVERLIRTVEEVRESR